MVLSSNKGVGEFFNLRPLGEHFGSLLAPLGHIFLYFFVKRESVIFDNTPRGKLGLAGGRASFCALVWDHFKRCLVELHYVSQK